MIGRLIDEHELCVQAKEVGDNWKELAGPLGLSWSDVEVIETEVRDPRDRPWRMLFEWYSRRGSEVCLADVQQSLQEVRREQTPREECK